jgi:ribulose-bisphosphate carboxylase large chain
LLDYVNTDYEPNKNDLIAMYYVEKAQTCKSLEQASEEIAKESSIGTWTEISTMSKEIAERLKPSVYFLNPKKKIIKVAYNKELFEINNVPQILSAVAGNIFGMKVLDSLRLLDISFPEEMVNSFAGPKYGIQGIKKITRINNRPLLGTIVKPKVGLNELKHAEVCGDAWKGGLDIVKDDENLTNMVFNHFKKRIKETLTIKNKIESDIGEKKFYMPNITGPFRLMKERADYVIENGGQYIMLDFFTIGFSALQDIREYLEDKDIIIHAHRAMHAAITRNKSHGITMLVLAKILRLIGVDQLHTGTIIGKMEGAKQEVLEINSVITEEKVKGNDMTTLDQYWNNLKPILPVASGGLSPLDIPNLIKILGKDMVFQFGGGCHGHPKGTEAGAKAIRQAVDAVMEGYELKEYAKNHSELANAIQKWGKN